MDVEDNEGFRLIMVIMTDKAASSKSTIVNVGLPYSRTRRVSRGLNFVQASPAATRHRGC